MHEWELEGNFRSLELEGLPARIRRSSMGTLCGYIGLPRDKLAQDNTLLEDLLSTKTHVAWTCVDNVDLGEPDYFWVGFDCMHSTDLIPISEGEAAGLSDEVRTKLDEMLNFNVRKRTYRTMEYVEQTLGEACRDFTTLRESRRLL